ncbi:MAG: ammonium transporter [Pseudomonadales bacterium]|jgi:Amt family ammonium transporter|nr:ammonium transporter [Pseudomonadales bacterium]MDP6469657.1 ammonium transporter [Pseudomonadales bacterium]MDP6828898.1 ammonium transporter [Pseudomonadales bacterium]|tara:strand:- start:3951 stop:5243 length:1293 start_codon:yes stop_codon:yes gene_type:complete
MRTFCRTVASIVALAVLILPTFAFAQEGLDTGNTSWIMTSTALVLFMTLPGLALFYGGLVRSQNVVSVLMHVIFIACMASVVWLIAGYGLAFGDGGAMNAYVGGLGKAFLSGVGESAMSGDIPESVFFMFQLTFAVITPALIVGAYVERIKFSAVIVFTLLWLLVVYSPVTHWVWGGGWLGEMGVMDFAGGLVVHATAGVSALVIAIMLGVRKGFPGDLKGPHSPGLAMMGACMLWVGWFGFNAGSALAANGDAGMAMLVTQISAATASMVWMGIEWVRFGKPSLVGLVTGTIAGLATVTPASGFIGPVGGLICGVAAGFLCYYITQYVKQTLKIDDSLDVFAVHAVGGILGTIMVSFLALEFFQGQGVDSWTSQLVVQAIGVVAVVIWSAIASFVIMKIVQATVGMRVSEEDEDEGLDITSHGERGYDL